LNEVVVDREQAGLAAQALAKERPDLVRQQVVNPDGSVEFTQTNNDVTIVPVVDGQDVQENSKLLTPEETLKRELEQTSGGSHEGGGEGEGEGGGGGGGGGGSKNGPCIETSEPTEFCSESTSVPTESTSESTESTSVPTESTSAPTESTEN
jgi:hypothetical protein